MAEVAPFQMPFSAPVKDDSLEVEQGLIGCLLMNAARALPRIPDTFATSHYAIDLHRSVHEATAEIGVGADLRTIAAALNLPPEDRNYLAGLLMHCPGWMMAPDYAHSITEAHRRRVIKIVLDTVQADILLGHMAMPATAIINRALAGLEAVLDGTHHHGAGGALDASMDAALDQADRAAKGEAIAGRSTGMPSVDEALGGLENGTFNILAARPGMGKTSLAVQWAVNVARACHAAKDGGVVGFSLEMPRVALGRRVLAEAAGISVVDMKRGRIAGRMEKLIRVRKELTGLPLWVEDAGGQNLIAIRQKARAAARRYGRLALVWVDHINIVKPDEIDRKNGSTQATGRISNALRDLSKEFECPVVCLAQLNRGLLAREDKRPNLGDLRQAGDIEQDADSVAFLHREEMFLGSEPMRIRGETVEKWQARMREWDEDKIRLAGKAELILAKVRDGAPCTVPLMFDGPTTSFSEPGAVPPSSQQPSLDAYADRFEEPAGLWPT